MSWYRAGTVSVSQGSNAVIGVGTAFISNARVGDAFRGPDGGWYEITNIASNTALSIAPNYQGPTLAAGGYSLAPMQGYVKDSADQLRAATKAIAAIPDTKQDKAANLTAFAGLAGAVDRLPYFTGEGALSIAVLTAKGRQLLARTDSAGMQAELGIGTAATLVATTSSTDFTVGRALKVADFGIGSNQVPLIQDFGADVRPGWYYGYGAQHASATLNAPPGSGGGALGVIQLQGINSANYKSVIACSQASATDADMFFGSRVSAAPPTWKRMLSLENCTRDPALGTGGIISTTVVSGFTITKFIGGLLLIQGMDPGTASVAANAILTVNTTVPSVISNLTLTNVIVNAVPSSTNDFGGTTNALMTTGTNLRYTIKNGATAQTFTPRITIFSRWQ